MLEPGNSRKSLSRSSWFMLFALGSFQGMGRTQEEQHRNFVRHCQERGWWDVFTDSDPREEPERWMNIIEEYADAQHDDEEWAQWLGQFPKLYRLRRWLNDYAEVFQSINQYTERFTLDAVLSPRSNPHLQGGGVDAPPLARTLKVGSHLVVRELLHQGVIENPLAVPLAYAPIERIGNFFGAFGETVSTSEQIHQLLERHLGKDGATFSGDYDIPLRIISSDNSLRRQLLLESKLEDRLIEALRCIEVEGEAVEVEEDLGGDAPEFRLSTAGFTYFMTPQPELGTAEGVTAPCRPDFVIRHEQGSDDQPSIAIFTDGFKYHRDRTDDDAAKRMALVHAGYLVWSLTWHDLEAVLGDGDEATDLLGEDDGHMTQRQQELDAKWSTGQIRSYLAEPSLTLLVRYLQNPGTARWKYAVATHLLQLFQPANMRSDALRTRYVDATGPSRTALRDSLPEPPAESVFAGRGRWCGTPPNFAELLLTMPLDALDHGDPTELGFVLHLDDVESRDEDYRREWNGVLRLYNLLQFLPNAKWTTTKGSGRRPRLQERS